MLAICTNYLGLASIVKIDEVNVDASKPVE